MWRFWAVLVVFLWVGGAWAQTPAPTPTVAGVALGTIVTQTRVVRMSFSADGAQLATLGYPLDQDADTPPRLYIWDASTRQLLREVLVEGAVFYDVRYLGETLLTTTETGEVIALETRTFAPVLRVNAHDMPALIAISPDGQAFATADGKAIALWASATLEVTGFLFSEATATPRWLENLFFSADGRTLGALYAPALFVLWDIASNAPLRVYDTYYTVEPYSAAQDEAGRLLLAYGTLEVWEEGTRVDRYVTQNAVYHFVRVGAEHLLTAEADGTLNLWHAPTKQIARVVRSGTGELITQIAPHPTLSFVAVAEENGVIVFLALP